VGHTYDTDTTAKTSKLDELPTTAPQMNLLQVTLNMLTTFLLLMVVILMMMSCSVMPVIVITVHPVVLSLFYVTGQ